MLKKQITSMLDESIDATNNVLIEEVGDVHVGDVVIDRVGFEDLESTLMALKHLKKFLE